MNDQSAVHHYQITCNWTGSTLNGYELYDRTHTLSAAPAEATITASSDPGFFGNPALLNPEQMLVMATASCQMLSFLAIAARKRFEVIEYRDQAEGFMPTDDKPLRITRIVLRPHIVIAGQVEREQVERAVERAHQICFISNSLNTEVTIEPEMEFRS